MPFEGIAYALLRQHVEDDPPPMAGVPPWLSDAVGALLAKDPLDRPEDGEAAAALLRPPPGTPAAPR